MFCAVTGNAPERPVVSKTGHLFEGSIIEKYIENTGKCPITGEALALDDLLAVKTSTTVKPRTVAATSIPGMLSLFQNEWDALMLETYTLKQQLETVREELGHALYQHDAACRVIARLIKERDDARKALAEAQPSMPAAAPPAAAPAAPMDVDSKQSGMTPEIVAKFDATSKSLSKGRKKRQPPAGQASPEALAAYTVQTSLSVSKAGPVCVAYHPSEALAVTGGNDGAVTVIDVAAGKTTAKCSGHKKRVTCARLHPNKMVISSSLDGTARAWSAAGEAMYTVKEHSDAVTDCSIHATGDYFVTASSDKSWGLFDVSQGACVLRVQGADAGYTCAGFHPDGLILGTGTGAVLRIWDVKSQSNVANFEGHENTITSMSFSENGYYLATGSLDKSVKIWDLRKLTNFNTLPAAGSRAVNSVSFDFSGQYLAVGSSVVSVYETKTWSSLATFDDAGKADVTGVAFAGAAASFAASSSDGVVKLYGSK